MARRIKVDEIPQLCWAYPAIWGCAPAPRRWGHSCAGLKGYGLHWKWFRRGDWIDCDHWIYSTVCDGCLDRHFLSKTLNDG